MATDSASPHGRSDADLIASVRAGRIEEYGALYERHVEAADRLARQLCPDRGSADDVVAEAFATVLDTLREGRGPDSAFRVHLLATVRTTAEGRARKTRLGAGPAAPAVSAPSSTDHAAGAWGNPTHPAQPEYLERSLVARAFSRLPERWQVVLWHTVIERESPSDVAPLLGLSPNTVSALAYRAREALRQECLQAHLAETSARRCRATAAKLGVWARDGLSIRERAQVEQHLDHCARCRALADELADINASLRGVVAFLVLGGAAFGYLAAGGGAQAAEETSAVPTGPRHFLGVAVSGVALATAVAVALTAGGVGGAPVAQHSADPVAEPQSPPATPSAPSVPSPPSPSTGLPSPQPSLPSLPAPRPEAGSYQPSRPSDVIPPVPLPPPARGDTEPEESETPPPASPPDPGAGVGDDMAPPPSPRITASVPEDGVEVYADGEAAELDITVRNDGDATAQDTVVALTLPDGVTAVDAPDDENDENNEDGGDDEDSSENSGDGADEDTQLAVEVTSGSADGTARSTGTDSATVSTVRKVDTDSPTDSPEVKPDVDCPAGEGTVDCVLADELGPDESALLRFRIAASSTAASGEATGTVTATGADPARFTVPITVEQDNADLDVSAVGKYLFVELRNDGVRTAEAALTLTVPAEVLTTHRLECKTMPGGNEDDDGDNEDNGDSLRCESHRPLEPGETTRLWTRLPRSHDADTVTITGTVGDDTVSRTVESTSPLPEPPEATRPDVPDTDDPSTETTQPEPNPTTPGSTPENPENTEVTESGEGEKGVADTATTVTSASSTAPERHAWSSLGSQLREWLSRSAGRRIRPRQTA